MYLLKLILLLTVFQTVSSISYCYEGVSPSNIFPNCTSQQIIDGTSITIPIYRLGDGNWYPSLNNSFVKSYDFSINPLGNDIICNKLGFRDKNCEVKFMKNQTGSLTYAIADPSFCSKYLNLTGSTCVLGGTCQCFLVEYISETWETMKTGPKLRVINTTNLNVRFLLEENSTQSIGFDAFAPYKRNVLRNTGTLGHTPIDSENVFAAILGNTVVFKFTKLRHDDDTIVDHQVIVMKEGYKEIYNTKEPTLTITLPDVCFILPGYLIYDISIEAKFVNTGFLYVSSKDYCPASWNPFSLNTWKFLMCLEWYQILFHFFVLIILLGMVIRVHKYYKESQLDIKDRAYNAAMMISTPIVFILYILFFCCIGKNRLAVLLRNKVKSKINGMKYMMEEEVPLTNINKSQAKSDEKKDKDKTETQIMKDGDASIFVNSESTSAARYNSAKKVSYTGLVILGLISVSLAQLETPITGCSSGAILPITLNSCIKFNSSYEECTTNLVMHATIPFVQSSACFAIVDDKNHNYFGRIIYESFQEEVPLDFKYVTSDWTGKAKHKGICPSCGFSFTALCDYCNSQCCEDICDTINVENDKTWNGISEDFEFTNFPGESHCRQAWNSEGNCGLSFEKDCLMSGYSIVPSDKVGWVYKQKTHTFKPIITFELWDGATYTSEYVTMDTLTKDVSGIQVQLLGSLLIGETKFPHDDFIYFLDNSWKNIESAKEGIPEKLLIGDIQATSSASLLYPTSTSFIYDRDVASKLELSSYDDYTFIQSGFSKLPQYPSLPNLFNGNIWNVEDFQLKTYRNDGPAIEVFVDFGSSWKFTRVLQRICPVVSDVESSGCFNCEVGSSAAITAKSDCFPGVVKVSSDSDYVTIHTTFMSLTSEDVVFIINFDTSKQSNDFNIILSTEDENIKVPIKYYAIEPENPLVSEIHYNTPFNNPVSPTKPDESQSTWSKITDWFSELPNHIKDFFTGALSWTTYVYVALIIFGIVVVFILSIKLIKFFRFSKLD